MIIESLVATSLITSLTFGQSTLNHSLSMQALQEDPYPYEFFQKMQVSGKDRTTEFKDSFVRLSEDEKFEDFKDTHVLLIAGLLSDLSILVKNNPLAKWIGLKNKFQDQIEFLTKNQITYDLVNIESEAAPKVNGAIICKSIEESKKQIIIFSHSKGSTDTLTCFVSRPDLLPKVRGWISSHGAFWGTPAAEIFLQNRWLKWPSNHALRWLGGGIESVESLSVYDAIEFNLRNEEMLKNLPNKIPLVSFASYKPDVPGKWDTYFEPYFRDWLEEGGLQNDGLVPWKSQIFPGSHYVLIEGMDHFWGLDENNDLQKSGLGGKLMAGLFIMLREEIRDFQKAH
ncbi:MAG: hypothetical protein COV44_02020 [Deltaproteobacteria bacterium CG11_big_fil_rev_8_21_14_0_20_45_16]|nr:MAG: hypothetical protein COV44_02020 [Deltaproteobacteria bacterium CG11_big_fil_rev_8_21_14_0_20_45_16]